jgi:hypothetical protein
MLGQRPLRLGRRADRLGGAREGHEEGVSLRIDLTTLPGGKGLAQDAALVGQQRGIALAQLLQQAGGAFDIGEQEGDRAFRQRLEGNLNRWLGIHRAPPLIKQTDRLSDIPLKLNLSYFTTPKELSRLIIAFFCLCIYCKNFLCLTTIKHAQGGILG